VSTFVALLRGINVGGRNKIPMAELRSLLSSLGLEDVVTYIQSGNVVFRSASGDTHEIAASIEHAIVEAFGFKAVALTRTPAELGEIVDSNPYLTGETDLAKLHVVFLDRPPGADAVAELDPRRSPPDEFYVRGREIYLHLPNGAGRSKLTIAYFERRLAAAATARNWNTLLKLHALARQ
jgi:uncharacterized protein (DUF1697 family)